MESLRFLLFPFFIQVHLVMGCCSRRPGTAQGAAGAGLPSRGGRAGVGSASHTLMHTHTHTHVAGRGGEGCGLLTWGVQFSKSGRAELLCFSWPLTRSGCRWGLGPGESGRPWEVEGSVFPGVNQRTFGLSSLL